MSYIIGPVIPKLFNFLIVAQNVGLIYYLQMPYKPEVTPYVYLTEKCKSKKKIVEV